MTACQQNNVKAKGLIDEQKEIPYCTILVRAYSMRGCRYGTGSANKGTYVTRSVNKKNLNKT
jgi:hypothetical protein